MNKRFTDSLIYEYQNLIIDVYSNLKNKNVFTKKDITIPSKKIESLRHNLSFNDYNTLVNELLIKDDNGWIPTHFNLLYKLSTYRLTKDGSTVTFDTRIHYKSIVLLDPLYPLVPSGYNIKSLIEEIDSSYLSQRNISRELYKLILEIFQSLSNKRLLKRYAIEKLTHHQLNSIIKFLTSIETTKVLVAPTGTGKTYIFFLYVLIRIIEEKIKGGKFRVILIYPRKALAVDQINRFINWLDAVNLILMKHDISPITIGIRDGDTPKKTIVMLKKKLKKEGLSLQ